VLTQPLSPTLSFWSRPALQVAALVLLCVIIYGYGLGRLPLVGPDEPRYAQVAREMYLSGDWITPRLADIQWFEKPALVYWLAATGYTVFGINEFAARLGVALLAGAGVLLLYLFGRQIKGPRFGFYSAAALATMGLWIGFARGATFDLPLSVTMELALLSFFLWWEREKPQRSRGWWVVCSVACGLALLAKGLVGLLLTGATVGLYLLSTGQLRSFFGEWRAIAVGALIIMLTAGTWYGPMFARHGRVFFHEFFVAHHFQRYLTDKYRHPQPVYFFFFVALAGSFPWIGYLIQAVGRERKRWRDFRRTREGRLRLFLWLWVLLPIIFFSFSGSKLPGYILPIFPALALLIGWELDEHAAESRRAGITTGLLLIVAAAAASWVETNDLGVGSYRVWTMTGLGIAVGVIILALGYWHNCRMLPPMVLAGVAVLVIAATQLVFPGIGAGESLRELSLTAQNVATPGERLVFYIDNHHGIDFYATKLPLRDERSELVTVQHGDEIAKLLAESPTGSLLVMSFERWLPSLAGHDRFDLQPLDRQERHRRCSPGCDWVLARIRSR
jgi:4-amino-4-deoxy-L-arabinose transferase-like glycosyltransferase